MIIPIALLAVYSGPLSEYVNSSFGLCGRAVQSNSQWHSLFGGQHQKESRTCLRGRKIQSLLHSWNVLQRRHSEEDERLGSGEGD